MVHTQYHGMVMMKVPTAGNHTRPLCTLTNFMTIYENTGCDPLSQENISSSGEPFQDFPGLFQSWLVFPLRFLVSEVSHTYVYLLRVSFVAPLYYSCVLIIALELGLIQSRKRRGTVTPQCVLQTVTHCRPLHTTYYTVSFTCTVHIVHCTHYVHSLFPMLRFHLQHLFTTHSVIVHILTITY